MTADSSFCKHLMWCLLVSSWGPATTFLLLQLLTTLGHCSYHLLRAGFVMPRYCRMHTSEASILSACRIDNLKDVFETRWQKVHMKQRGLVVQSPGTCKLCHLHSRDREAVRFDSICFPRTTCRNVSQRRHWRCSNLLPWKRRFDTWHCIAWRLCLH